MQKSATLVLTSYDLQKIEGAISKIKKSTSKLHVTTGEPVTQKIKLIEVQPPIWGCKKADLKRQAISLNGSEKDLQKLTKITVPQGVYLQLLLQ